MSMIDICSRTCDRLTTSANDALNAGNIYWYEKCVHEYVQYVSAYVAMVCKV